MSPPVVPPPPAPDAIHGLPHRGFDPRREVPPEVAGEVAEAILAAAPRGSAGWLVDLGAGAGALGGHLAAGPLPVLAGDGPGYLPGAAGRRVVLDLHRRWPLAAASVALLFADSASHRVDARWWPAELRRVAAPGARLVLGRVRRDRDNPGPRMRRELGRLLGARPRTDGDAVGRLLAALRSAGAHTEAPRTVASWADPDTPGGALSRWRAAVEAAEPGRGIVELAGSEVSRHVAETVLDRLEAWARRHWPDLNDVTDARRAHYELTVVGLPA